MKTLQPTISEVRLVYRTKIKASEKLQVKSSKDAFDIFMENWDQDLMEHIEKFPKRVLKATIIKSKTCASHVPSEVNKKALIYMIIRAVLMYYC